MPENATLQKSHCFGSQKETGRVDGENSQFQMILMIALVGELWDHSRTDTSEIFSF
jgi:hypothetical protein